MPRSQSPKRTQRVLPGMVKLEPRKQVRDNPEHREQVALMRWARVWANHGTHPVPQLRLLHSSLNGARLSPAQRKKASDGGMLAGVWDLFLPCASHGYIYCGLYIEMKAGRNDLTHEQQWFWDQVGDDYDFVICRAWHEAAITTLQYLGIPRTHPAWYGLEVGK
jgi:hypothetical protein